MANQQFKDLNFASAKTALKAYLSSKAEYTDHNFDGSTWNLLLDTMAWSIHYIGVQSNLALSEAFLDTADLRGSIVSRAKELGYFPKQNTSSTASIELSVSGIAPNNTNIYAPVGLRFSALLDGETFIFQNITKTRLYELDGTSNIPTSAGVPTGAITGTGNYKSFDPLILRQGFSTNKSWSVVNSATDRFIIYDKSIDTDSLIVRINNTDWQYSNDIVVADAQSEIFYLQEIDNNNVEIYFGDGILGKNITPGDTIDAVWISSKANRANDINIFEVDDTIAGIPAASFTASTLSPSAGGTLPDSNNTIKKIAPQVYAAQNRLVTSNDFEALLLSKFSYIDAISVWGGEEAVPPQYGKTFLSVSKLGSSNAVLTSLEKTNISLFLKKHSIVGIRNEIVDPEYINIDMNIEVTYNQYKTTKSDDQLIALIKNSIGTYYTNNLINFNSTLKMSRLLAVIDAAEPAISDSNSKITIYKNFQSPVSYYNSAQPITLNYGTNPLIPNSFYTSTFDGNKMLKDDGLGNIFSYINTIKQSTAIGTINYSTGSILVPIITINDAAATVAINANRASNSLPLISVANPITEIERSNYFEVIKFIATPDGHNILTAENNLLSRGTESIGLNILKRAN